MAVLPNQCYNEVSVINRRHCNHKASEYDQEMPQSQTGDQSTAT